MRLLGNYPLGKATFGSLERAATGRNLVVWVGTEALARFPEGEPSESQRMRTSLPDLPTAVTLSANVSFVFLLRVNRDFPGDGKPLRMCIIHTPRPRTRFLWKNPPGAGSCFERSGSEQSSAGLVKELRAKCGSAIILNVVVQEKGRLRDERV